MSLGSRKLSPPSATPWPAIAAWVNVALLALGLRRRGFLDLDARIRGRLPRMLLASLLLGERLPVVKGRGPHPLVAEAEMALDSDLKEAEALLEGTGFSSQDLARKVASIQVTQAVIYAWYDNEMGSYVNILGDRTVSIAENM